MIILVLVLVTSPLWITPALMSIGYGLGCVVSFTGMFSNFLIRVFKETK